MTLRLSCLALAAALSGCVTLPPNAPNGPVEVSLGQRAELGGYAVTPLRVLEDSRCPTGVQCVWAGRVRLEVRIEGDRARTTGELATDKPLALEGGEVSLLGVAPAKIPQRGIAPGDYRFTLGFRPGP